MTKRDHWVETKRLAELGLFSAELVHEIRQQVFAIDGLAQLALREGDTAGGELSQLTEQVNRMKELLARHAEASRRPTLEPQPVALPEVVARSVELVLPHAQRNGRTVSVSVEGEIEPLLCDPIAVQQVVWNLLRNAIDAAERHVSVVTSSSVIVVEDDGEGIANEVRDTLFEPFVTTKPPGVGTGLGLPVARHLVEAVGGTLTFTNGAGKTRFIADFGIQGDRDVNR